MKMSNICEFVKKVLEIDVNYKIGFVENRVVIAIKRQDIPIHFIDSLKKILEEENLVNISVNADEYNIIVYGEFPKNRR